MGMGIGVGVFVPPDRILYILCPRFPPCGGSGLNPSPGVDGGVDGRELSFEPPLKESFECCRDDNKGLGSLSWSRWDDEMPLADL